jgi:hypothetical protein
MKKNKVTIIWIIVAIIAFVGGWWIGRATVPAATSGRGAYAGASSTRGTFASRGGAASGGLAMGQVLSIDSQSITLQLANGNSENVFYSSSTPVIIPQPASISSITPGTNVIITGTANSDGSLTAESIQVRNNPTGAAQATH